MTIYITLPGIGGSGPTHWQSRWEAIHPAVSRFQPADWDAPVLDDWHDALDRAVAEAHEPPVLVAHSLACLLVARWQARSDRPVRGALLVAVPDPDAAVFPAVAAPFGDVPVTAFRFPSLIVASTDDPYGRVDYATARARDWRSRLEIIGARGHLNGASGLGDWPAGWGLVQTLA